MKHAFDAVWQTAQEHQVSLRTAAYIVACTRILNATICAACTLSGAARRGMRCYAAPAPAATQRSPGPCSQLPFESP